MKTFPTSAVWCFGILFISASLITTGSSEVQVVGPADPVVALAGDDIILPCSLEPNVSAEDMAVEWTGLYLRTRNVHLYLDGRDSNEDQFPSYRGRTSMFHEELKNGNVSLKLTRVTLSDAGSYRCFIPTLTSQVKETTVQLFVGAVSQPVISIDGTKGWGVVLKCDSGGWFPEPGMEWLDSSGTILPADGPPEKHRDSEDLYALRQHVTVNKTDTNMFTCRVNQTEINHLKETEFHVPDDVFPKSHVGLIIGLSILLAVVVLAASAGVYKWRKYTEEQRERLEEQENECRKLLEEQVKGFKLIRDMKRDAKFVNRNKVHLSQNVTMVTIAFYLICSERYSEIHVARTRQDQMRLFYEALDSGGKKVKSDFYRILLDLEPDLVIDLDELLNLPGHLEVRRPSGSSASSNWMEDNDLYELNKNLTGQLGGLQGELNKVKMEKDGLQGELIELNEKLRKAEETIQSLSTSPGGQQETQTPSQKSERIEGMEMKSLPGPGRKSVPEMKPLLAAGPQNDDLDEMERGGRVTTDNNSML
ncbi:butyrophilin subfamily 1 member A1-like isoform X5 [Oncorhynchus kisutch]|uniref:Butyrophilin subfamily 1 member A1-like n=1 Tax=Oncorhynchus kisutch TaxID=8019 RepID=A0A8C7M2J9_ONCKI|nr:butyrophilin subfamily 1 member A1-like isoform X5 [Oncorhynchus kisutch]